MAFVPATLYGRSIDHEANLMMIKWYMQPIYPPSDSISQSAIFPSPPSHPPSRPIVSRVSFARPFVIHGHIRRSSHADLLLSTSLTFIIILLFFSLQLSSERFGNNFLHPDLDERAGEKEESPTRKTSSVRSAPLSSRPPAAPTQQVSPPRLSCRLSGDPFRRL